jgi:hypothetical protein
MTRSLIPLLAVFALACGAQDAAPPPAEPAAPAPAVHPEAAPVPEAVEAPAYDTLTPTFEGEHAMARAEAAKAGVAWVEHMDAGKIGEGWEASSALLQDSKPKDVFVEAVGAARNPQGAMKQRTLSRIEYAAALPGAPEGEYVLIEYKTAFENKEAAVETVITTLDWDGVWKVAGYDVR